MRKYCNLILSFLVLLGCTSNTNNTVRVIDNTTTSRIEVLNYDITYNNQNYQKALDVYVPVNNQEPLDVLYLMHGSTGSAHELSTALKPLLDEWIATEKIKPMLVVFPTYYPDRSFVVSNYFQDYPLNRFFAQEEIKTVINLVENNFPTFSNSTSTQDLIVSRKHRAFGGYSMGAVTTWDILAHNPQYFYDYMPMAGDSWIGRNNNLNVDEVSDLLVSGLIANKYSQDDFNIIAMVGENDGTKYSMIPQLDALRRNHANLISDNLSYWENRGGGHNLDSLLIEVEYGIQKIFKKP